MTDPYDEPDGEDAPRDITPPAGQPGWSDGEADWNDGHPDVSDETDWSGEPDWSAEPAEFPAAGASDPGAAAEGDQPAADDTHAADSVDDAAASDRSREDSGVIAGLDRASLRVQGWPVVGRPVRWARRPWSTERSVMVAVTAITLCVATFVMMKVTHMWQWPILGSPWRPWEWEWQGIGGLVFRDNTPTGGDMGAHVWSSAYLRDELIPNWQLSGWSMDWYAGLPVYRFYMVLPALAIVALNSVFAYGVAFKLVAVAGLVMFPLACWSFGRLARFRYPLPELFAIAALCFTLDESFEIYGGNLKSTMAGEFSFSIALTLAMFGLGLLARSMETGRYRVRTALVLAAACISHGIVLIFVMVAATVVVAVWLLVTLDRRRLFHALVVGGLTFALAAFWTLPFIGNRSYMTDMKYQPKPADGFDETFWTLFFPLATSLDIIITTFAVVGVAAVVLRRQINGVALAVTGLLFVAGVYVFSSGGLPFGIGLLWNPRLLPFIYLIRYLLMMIGIFEVVTLVVNAIRNRPGARVATVATRTAAWGVTGVAVYLVLGFMFQVLPFGGHVGGQYAWGPFRASAEMGRASGDGWARYNFSGYEGRDIWRHDEQGNPYLEDNYGQYHDLMQTMNELGDSRGCGRAYWENSEHNGDYGTTMALMLLPYWTEGCIASMEGLYFEASGTTPYHFVSSTAMSEQASMPVRELNYSHLDPEAGVPQLQALGVRYVMLRTDTAKEQIEGYEELTPIAESGVWTIYELAGSDIIVPLDRQPVVVNPRDGDQRERKLELGMSWFQHQGDWPAMPADGGPDDWQRIDVEPEVGAREFRLGEETLWWPELVARIRDGRVQATSSSVGPDTLIEQLEGLGGGDRTVLLQTDGDAPAEIELRRTPLLEQVAPTEDIAPTELDPVVVSNVEVDQQSLSFEVDEVGVPVLVKVSYFPNWNASGADGPWRVGPNMMVVVPTDHTVEMDFERASGDYVAYGLTFVGIIAAIVLRARRRSDEGHVGEFPPDTWYDDGTWEWGNDETALVSRYRAPPSVGPAQVESSDGFDDPLPSVDRLD